MFQDRFGRQLPETFTPAYAENPDYDDAGADALTVQKVTKGVSHETCRTQWCGETMDYEMAVSGLLAASG